jgi:hypothetical protein
MDTIIEFQEIIDTIDTCDDSGTMESDHLGTDIIVGRVELYDLDKSRELVYLPIVEFHDCIFYLMKLSLP